MFRYMEVRYSFGSRSSHIRGHAKDHLSSGVRSSSRIGPGNAFGGRSHPDRRVDSAGGVTQSHLSDVERGTRRLDLIELRDLAGVCGVSLVDAVAEFETRLKKKRTGAKR